MPSLLKAVDRLYSLFLKVLNSLQAPFLLGVRMVWGFLFLQSGIGKISNIDNVVNYFTNDLKIPHPSLSAHFVAGLETVGGILLILGLGSRIIAVPLVVNMIVAFLAAEHDAFIAFFSSPKDFFSADAFPFLLASLLVLLFGPGWFSFDALIAEYRKRAWRRAARWKLLFLLSVLLLVIYAEVYITIHRSGDSIYQILRWWKILFALIIAGGLAAAITRLIIYGQEAREIPGRRTS